MKTIEIRTSDNYKNVVGYAKIGKFPQYDNMSYGTNNNVFILTISYIGANGNFGKQVKYSVIRNSHNSLKITELTPEIETQKIEKTLAWVVNEDNSIDLYVKSMYEATGVATRINIEAYSVNCIWYDYSKFEDISSLNPNYSTNYLINDETLNLSYAKIIAPSINNQVIMKIDTISLTFSEGVATKDLTNYIESGYGLLQSAFANPKSTSTVFITGCSVNTTDKILTVKAGNKDGSYSGTTNVNVMIFLKKI